MQLQGWIALIVLYIFYSVFLYFLDLAGAGAPLAQACFVTQDFSYNLELEVESEINKAEKLSNCTVS